MRFLSRSFCPILRNAGRANMTVYVRTNLEPKQLMAEVRDGEDAGRQHSYLRHANGG